MSALDLTKNLTGFLNLFLRGLPPKIDHGMFATNKGPNHRFTVIDQVVHGPAHKADSDFDGIPSIPSIFVTKNTHATPRWTHEGIYHVE